MLTKLVTILHGARYHLCFEAEAAVVAAGAAAGRVLRQAGTCFARMGVVKEDSVVDEAWH